MIKPLALAAGAALLLGVAFEAGRLAVAPQPKQLEAQGGRGPVVPPKPRTEPTRSEQPLVYGGDSGSAAVANNGFIAVTGSYGVGTSVLYLFDTNNKQLVVYEGRGGSESMRRLTFVGARRIDLDLQLLDYNDRSEFRRADLQRMFKAGNSQTSRPKVTVPGALGSGEYKETRKNNSGR